MEKKQTFETFIKTQRIDFVREVSKYPVDKYNSLRTECDNLLIAYDQMASKLRSTKEELTEILLEITKNQREVIEIGGLRKNVINLSDIEKVFEKMGIKLDEPF